MAVSKEAMTVSYVAQFSVLTVVVTNFAQYLIHAGFEKPSYLSHFERFGTAYMQILAAVLILVAPLKSLVVDVCMQSFKQNGFDSTIEKTLELFYAPEFGQRPLQMYTALAYILMLWATTRQIGIFDKISLLTLKSTDGRKNEDCAS
eukprot:GEMP01047748.1.p1 GENE.GEMP01047748.1~~GEMP01047748.1.p1  ORF type:complete len:147 (+),score=19.63 GEMP01047748.1:162-602(+)